MTNPMTRKRGSVKPMSVRRLLGFFGVALIAGATLAAILTLSTTGSIPAYAGFRETPHSAPPPGLEPQYGGGGPAMAPGNAAPGKVTRAEMWRAVRHGISGRVSIADKKAGTLVQSEGENFRIVQNGPLPDWGGWLLLAVIVAIALFYAIRGRIRTNEPATGRMVERFNLFERFTHWLTAIAFILLALTGLNILYGRYVLRPIMGAHAFATMSAWGKYTHDWVSFLFMAGLVLMFVLWVAKNLPTKADAIWLLKGGGLFMKGVHPPAYRFNAGQKIMFWIVIIGGFSVAFSGLCLLMPFELHPFAPTFKFLNLFGLNLPTDLTSLQETQLALVWHAVVALILIALIIAHIYIGSFGMEGAFDAMVSGEVDEAWAREHHPLWLEKIKNQTPAGAAGQPAE